MATPIETNTEGLEGILQQVYNLPNRSTGGSSGPDLVISAPEDFFDYDDPDFSLLVFDSAQVVATYQKVLAGEGANVLFNFYMGVTSALPRFNISATASDMLASDEGNQLTCNFIILSYFTGTANTPVFHGYNINFSINPASGSATVASITHGYK